MTFLECPARPRIHAESFQNYLIHIIRHKRDTGHSPPLLSQKVVSSMTANKRWCQAETLARSSGNAANNGLRPRYYTKAPQPPVDRSRKQTRNGGVSEKTQVSLGSPVDIRRSADGVAAGERPWVMPWWGRGGGGNDRAGGVGARGGPWEKDPAAEQYQVPPPSYQDKHPIGQELQQQQQQQQIWGKNISAVHEVEDRQDASLLAPPPPFFRWRIACLSTDVATLRYSSRSRQARVPKNILSCKIAYRNACTCQVPQAEL